jgi:hypothetical protein
VGLKIFSSASLAVRLQLVSVYHTGTEELAGFVTVRQHDIALQLAGTCVRERDAGLNVATSPKFGIRNSSTTVIASTCNILEVPVPLYVS